MRPLRWLVFTLLLVLSVASPSWARVATIETAVPLQDHSEQSLKAALAEGVQTLAKGALAMGLSWLQVRQVLVQEDTLRIQVVATDTNPGTDGEGTPEQGGPLDDGAGHPTALQF
jgi:hypothetical protein